jgi:hypothetical protein
MRDDDGGNNRSVNIGQPPAFLKPLVPALLAILTGAVVQQLQTDWGWAAILLVGAILLPLAIWLGLREPRAQRPLIRYGFPALASAYVLLTAAFSILEINWVGCGASVSLRRSARLQSLSFCSAEIAIP